MKQEFDDALCAAYPKIFSQRHWDKQDTCMCWGFECGDGWYPLIDTLCAHLQWNTDKNNYPQVIATQVKEKFGGLRFYHVIEAKDGFDHIERHYGAIDGAISFAAKMSAKICEICGKPGEIKGEAWLRCVCPDHENV